MSMLLQRGHKKVIDASVRGAPTRSSREANAPERVSARAATRLDLVPARALASHTTSEGLSASRAFSHRRPSARQRFGLRKVEGARLARTKHCAP